MVRLSIGRECENRQQSDSEKTAVNEERKRIIKQAIEKKRMGVNLDYKFIQAQRRGIRTQSASDSRSIPLRPLFTASRP